jgi:uncharacterized protein
MKHILIALIRIYQLTFSMLIGRQCRHLPSCSVYTMEAVQKHGAWAGGWMGFSRICRCNPYGTSGLDFVCESLPPKARWFTPWQYGLWKATNLGTQQVENMELKPNDRSNKTQPSANP